MKRKKVYTCSADTSTKTIIDLFTIVHVSKNITVLGNIFDRYEGPTVSSYIIKVKIS